MKARKERDCVVDAGNKDSNGGKRKAYKKMLQKYVPEEVRKRGKREYMDSKALVKRLVRYSKERVDKDFGRKLSADYVENKKLFWR